MVAWIESEKRLGPTPNYITLVLIHPTQVAFITTF